MVIVVTGPTATGKSDLGIFLAKKLNGEIINADSTQIYKSMDIATNKVKDTEGIIHHLYDFLDINKDYTVFDYQKDCRKCIDDIISKEKTPILVGGTGLYIKAALYDYQFNNDENKQYENINTEKLYKKLLKVDPETRIHPNNRVRIIRALNYYETSGQPHSQKEKNSKLLYDCIFIGLTDDRKELYTRINKRVDDMLQEGLLEEAKQLYNLNIRSKAIMTPIGYKELFEYFDGNKSLEECIDLIKQKSRNYAKRQYTWFNHQLSLKWFNINCQNFSETKNEVLNYIKTYKKQ